MKRDTVVRLVRPEPLNDKTSPVMARLRALRTPAMFSPGALRVVAGPETASPLTALLREINETLLGRSLAFSTGGGASLTLDVAGRRILRVTAAKGLEGADACVAAPALDDANLADLARLLTGLAAAGPDLRVSTAPLGRSEGMSVGLPVARLADHLGIDLDSEERAAPAPEAQPAPEPAAEGFVAAFIAQMGEGLSAWLIRSGSGEVSQGGPEEMVAPLAEFLADESDALHEQLNQIAATMDEPVCSLLGADLVTGHSVLCLRAEGSLLLGVVAGNAAAEVLAAWNAVRR